MYASDVAQVNDRVTRLVGLLRDRGLAIEEDLLHPAVMEAEASAGVAAFARGQLAYTRSGRERIAEAAGLAETIGVEEAQALLAMPGRRDGVKRETKRSELRKGEAARGGASAGAHADGGAGGAAGAAVESADAATGAAAEYGARAAVLAGG